MKGLLLAGAVALCFGCVTPPQLQTATAPPAPAARAALPRIVYQVALASPQGQGVIELRQEVEAQGTVQTPVYRAYGGILAADDVARWRFTYTKTSLEGPGPTRGEWVDGLHAMSVILVNATRGELEVDWEHSTFIDASGRSQRMIHRGIQLNQRTAQMLPSTIAPGATLNEFVFPGDGISFSAPGRASVWNSPAVFERLVPGAEFSIVLSIRSGQTMAPRTFKFTVVPPPAAVAPAAPARAPAPTVVPGPAAPR
jgi:hypothetical protein